MSIRFFSGEEDARRGGQPLRESQQALLLRLLREANGATVSYQRLRDAGIELPASVVSELELAGIPIEHGHDDVRGERRPGVRLNPTLDPERPPLQSDPVPTVEADARSRTAPWKHWTIPSALRPKLPSHIGFSHLQSTRRSLPSGWRLSLPSQFRPSGHRPTTRALAPIALVGAMIVVIAVVVIALQASRGSSRHAAPHHVSRSQPRSAVVARTPQAPAPQPPATPVSADLATQFEAQGHDLLQSGQYSDAVAILRRALAATGMHLSDCLEPVNETCLTYAYALYDLGRALELNGDPTAAVPVLEKRLEIDNQRDVVAAELAHVRTISQP